jgi:hypothetical protein
VNAVKSIALAGGIRHRSLPGCRILSNRADCVRLAAPSVRSDPIGSAYPNPQRRRRPVGPAPSPRRRSGSS